MKDLVTAFTTPGRRKAFRLALILSLAWAQMPALWATDEVVSGDLDVQGANLNLGTAATDEPGLTWNYTDGGSTGTISLTATRNTVSWQWLHNSGTGFKLSMKLDSAHQLILYGSDGATAGITLNPAGTSAFLNGITIGGSAVLTSASAASTYLTQSSAASTYLTSSTANSLYVRRDAYGTGSIAMISDSYTVGWNALAINGAGAVGDGTVAMLNSTANGQDSVAIGSGSVTDGQSAVAIGVGTVAQSFGQMAVGRYNIAQGNSTSWVTTDDLFVIGNGTAYNARSNALVVKKSGDTLVNGQLTVSQKARFDQAVRVAPQGDISMGEFTAEP